MKFLNENPSTVITPLIRYGLIFIGGGLVSKGAISTLFASAWMFTVKYRNGKNGGA